MSKLSARQSTVVRLKAGHRLTIVTDGAGIALVTRFSTDTGASKLEAISLGASTTEVLGEYYVSCNVQIDCNAGTLTYADSQVTDPIASTIPDSDTFTGLTDAPNSYTGQHGKVVAVKSDETGVEFVAAGGGGSNGMELLVKGSITTPVSYIDFSLPNGYSRYEMMLTGVACSVNDNLSAAFSNDGGSTFHNGANDYSTSHLVVVYNNSPPGAGALTDSMLYLQDVTLSGPTSPASIHIAVMPGSSSEQTQIISESTAQDTTSLPTFAFEKLVGFYQGTPARMDTIRLQPYGNGDTNPPTSSNTITSGHYVLWGIQQ